MRSLITLAALSALTSLATPVQAASESIWDHNGSKMTLEANADKRKLVYTEPREGLDKAGIRKGTVLFNGSTKPNGRLAGFAKIFKASCNPIDYFVEGTFNEARGEIVLQGQAPTYASGTSCEVTGYSDSSPASTLKFSRIGDAPPDSAAIAQGDPGAGIEQGDGGRDDDYLPPSQRNRSASRPGDDADQPPLRRDAPQQSQGSNGRDANPPVQNRDRSATVDQNDPDNDPRYAPPRDRRYYGRYPDDQDRRYSRAPDPYDTPTYRRRPGVWDPDDEAMPDEDADYDVYDRRWRSPIWGYRRPWWYR
jgi:hypothetical protein